MNQRTEEAMAANAVQFDKRTYTVDEIQDILGISRTSAYNLVKKKVFHSVRIGGSIRISKRVLMSGWIIKCKICQGRRTTRRQTSKHIESSIKCSHDKKHMATFYIGGCTMAEMRKRTSMSVLEMGRMLGLGKTESYWLIKKNYFKTILVGNTMRVMIDSFEEWYANQFKYQKVDGTPPGEELKKTTYSMEELGQRLGLKEATAYELVAKGHFDVVDVLGKRRVTKESFERCHARIMDKYYRDLLSVKAVSSKYVKARTEYLTPHTVREVHKTLRNAFNQAVKWELMTRNPVEHATLPKEEHKTRDIWTAEVLQKALEACDDDILRLAINLAFSCSLRMGELLGLTWDCIDISPTSIELGQASIFVEKELQRVNREAMADLDGKDIMFKFPPTFASTHTAIGSQTPKTKTSVRKVFLPKIRSGNVGTAKG